jgi:hypothetical protein
MSTFKKFKSFKPPPLLLRRDAGEDEGGGLTVLNCWNQPSEARPSNA